jgi:hypothetical protein
MCLKSLVYRRLPASFTRVQSQAHLPPQNGNRADILAAAAPIVQAPPPQYRAAASA